VRAARLGRPKPPGAAVLAVGPGAVVSLTAGRHTLRLLGAAAGVDLDRILMTANLNAPGAGSGA